MLKKHKGKLILVSNRLPVTIVKKGDKLSLKQSIGGLATGVGSFYKSYRSLWIGWPGVVLSGREKERKEIEKILAGDNCRPVFLSQHYIDNFYHGFCNKTIWPLFHYFPLYTVFSDKFWKAYKQVNQHFCEKVVEVADGRNIIWVHDFQLLLLPRLIRERLPDATIGFFLHIPFPSSEIFRLLPWREEILKGILGADLIGFHTYDYALHFLSSVRRVLGYEPTFGQVFVGNRMVRVDAFPMGINYRRYANAAKDINVQKEIEKIKKKVRDSKIIISVDRLDYTKGIPQRIEAFDLFLEENPEYKEKIMLVLVAVPSRGAIDQYIHLRRQVDELVGKINGKYGTIGWTPVWYLHRSLSFDTLAALYAVADVTLVTSIRDGMNLVAKEFIAAKAKGEGVLIISETAGASKELCEAIIVNPNNKNEVAEAIKKALSMSRNEKLENIRGMQFRLKRYDVKRWANDFMDRLMYIKGVQSELSVKRLTSEFTKKRLLGDYAKSKHNLILLDYDGTLVPLALKPEMAKPDEELIALLSELTQNPRNEVVIASGRAKGTLTKWFSGLDIGLIAEHGVWVKKRARDWEMVEPVASDWKDEIKPILELYADRTPGSFVEEKEFSLVWHYRKADGDLAAVRTKELKDALWQFTSNLNLGVLEGSKVIEIKNASLNKGRAALRWMLSSKWYFILAIGDDWTDEDIFEVLPDTSYSVKVGLGPSKARFYLYSPYEVRSLLKELTETASEK
jgi:trehalose 6-phosphate synthase/phosphatase